MNKLFLCLRRKKNGKNLHTFLVHDQTVWVHKDGCSKPIRPSTSARVEIDLALQNTLGTCSVHKGPTPLWSVIESIKLQPCTAKANMRATTCDIHVRRRKWHMKVKILIGLKKYRQCTLCEIAMFANFKYMYHVSRCRNKLIITTERFIYWMKQIYSALVLIEIHK